MTESLPEDHQELEFEFDFPNDPVNFRGDHFNIKSNSRNYGKLEIPKETGDQLGGAFIVILSLLLLYGFILYSLLFNSQFNSQISNSSPNFDQAFLINLFSFLSCLMLIMSFVIYFNPFLRFLSVKLTAFDEKQTLHFRSQFGIHKFSSLVKRNYWSFIDYNHHTAYSLYFSHNKGFFKINKSRIVLDMKKFNDSTLELINKDYNFTIKLNKNNLSKKMGNFVIYTPNKVDEYVVLFIGFVLYTTGHLNSLLEEIAFQSIRIEPERNKLMYGLISAVLNALVFPSITVCLALTVLPSLLHATSQWGTFFMIIDLILFSILWFYLIKNLLVTPIKHLKKNIWSEGDSQTYGHSIAFAVMILSMFLILMFMIVSNPQFHSFALVFLPRH